MSVPTASTGHLTTYRSYTCSSGLTDL